MISTSLVGSVLHRLARLSLSQKLGMSLLILLVVFAIFAPWMTQASSDQQNLSAILIPPNAEAWLGTDHYGRSMWVRLAEALRLSLLMAALSVITAASLGIVLGTLAAVGPRWVDRILDGVMTILLALPGLVLVLILSAMLPGSFGMLYLAIALVQWVEYFRVVRAMAKQVVQGPAMVSSRQLGFGFVYCFKRHIWPAIAPQIMTIAAFGAASSVLMMASLGFVYVGIQPPTAELGLMIVELFPYYSDAPWLLAEPLMALGLFILSCHLLAQKAPDTLNMQSLKADVRKEAMV